MQPVLYQANIQSDDIFKNLAFEQFLLAKAAKTGNAFYTIWQNPLLCIVLGRGDNAQKAVNVEACKNNNVTVSRRKSGGGAVLLDKRVLCYSFFLPNTMFGELWIEDTFDIVAQILKNTLKVFNLPVRQMGVSDLVIGDKKISGNACAKVRGAAMVHGTLLLHDISQDAQKFLNEPRLPPSYRKGRKHQDFILSLDKFLDLNVLQNISGIIVRHASNVLSSEIRTYEGFQYEFETWLTYNNNNAYLVEL